MSEESKERKENRERSPQQLAKSRREAQAKVLLAEDKRTQEAAEIHRALGLKALKSSAAATTLDTARTVYIQLLASLGSNAEVKAEVTRFRDQLDQMQLQMLARKPRKRSCKGTTAPIVRINLGPLSKLAAAT
jgi:hypothetical protein